MPDWRVLIVEDDPVVADLHRKLLRRRREFEVVGVAASAEATLRGFAVARPDLVLLDLTLNGIDGVALLRRLRAIGSSAEVIAITATRDAAVVRDVVQLGAIDYLIKPFAPQRLELALQMFLHRAFALRDGDLDQLAVDVVCASGRPPKRWLPKGLSEERLTAVEQLLASNPGGVTAQQVATSTGSARVTARRYLEYLEVSNHVASESYGTGPGRPQKLYRPIGLLAAASRQRAP